MKPFTIIQYLLLAAAILSGIMTMAPHIRVCSDWKNASSEMRTEMTLGMYAPAVLKVRATVPETERLLLISGIDPALFPYTLFPRKIWQKQTAPETDQLYMNLPPSAFPERPPESFPVGWLLDINQDNVANGGALTRLHQSGGSK